MVGSWGLVSYMTEPIGGAPVTMRRGERSCLFINNRTSLPGTPRGPSSIHSFTDTLLSTYCVPGSVQGTDTFPASTAHIFMGKPFTSISESSFTQLLV